MVILVSGVVVGAGIWLTDVEVTFEYDKPSSSDTEIQMSQSETGDYQWTEPLSFGEIHNIHSDFGENPRWNQYYQYLRVTNNKNENITVDVYIENPESFEPDQMKFKHMEGIVEPGDKFYDEAVNGSISFDIQVNPGETVNHTVVYQMTGSVPENGTDEPVIWQFRLDK